MLERQVSLLEQPSRRSRHTKRKHARLLVAHGIRDDSSHVRGQRDELLERAGAVGICQHPVAFGDTLDFRAGLDDSASDVLAKDVRVLQREEGEILQLPVDRG